MKFDLKLAEKQIMSGLKDFQRATVERVFHLYKHGQNRVLVADEVGLGKTLVAKGVIAKTARYQKEHGDDLFKVIYICSNQNIANQNISKLKLTNDITVDGVTDTRLSMQHLKIFQQENDQRIKDQYIQLIPLTPSTSFSMTNGCGSFQERALMYAILKRMKRFEAYIEELEVIMMDEAFLGWNWASSTYENRVVAVDDVSGGKYLKTITKAISEYFKENRIDVELLSLCKKTRANDGQGINGTYKTLNKFRIMFAQISVDMLQPDLVVMDEFQRFRFLISADLLSETGLLVDRFLKGDNTKILMLSATPYKLYSTLEEINETLNDDHYQEFLQVMDFLFHNEQRQQEFKEIWNNFSIKLREKNLDDWSIIEAKQNAENAMYQSVCRTERISAINTGDFIDDKSVRKHLKATEKDILSFIDAERLLKEIDKGYSVPVDYIKSSPYILSFMKQYQLKKHLEKFFRKNPDNIKIANKKTLWLEDRVIKNYGMLETNNARLERLKDVAFENNAEMLLWVPPSKPYYEPQGVFREAGNFSKVLVFSAWEMVPRMIASLISYEAERKTVGKLAAQNKDKQNTSYFAPNNKRFPVARLRFNVVNGNPQAMSLFCLLYPSNTLADLYNPMEYLNVGKSLQEIEKDIKARINELLQNLRRHQPNNNREDERWYYLAPLLLDDPDYTKEWLSKGSELVSVITDDEEEKGQKGFKLHLERLKEYYHDISAAKLGKIPSDLPELLCNIVLASPSLCAYRANGRNSIMATQLAKAMINQFNKPEATAVIELCYGETNEKSTPRKRLFNSLKESLNYRRLDEAHWRNVLSYCKDGNLQALLDEYVHIIAESNSLNHAENKHELIHKYMLEALRTHSASYTVDTFKTFKNNIMSKREKGMAIRSHYAVGFYKGEGENSKLVNRKESIRSSFNSPFRPFVLATTSIGQEGLDFHFYCRKIMHWNLPSNPIDLEQREGRINRFKGLAIRQNIALKYDRVLFHNDVWTEMFEQAKEDYKTGYSELIPYWCLPDNQEIKIERIVPMYPISKDIGSYERLIKILSLYRLTLGQARQEELLEYIFKNCENSDKLKKLFINLSPFYREHGV